jgi:hypothetical protein
MERCCNRRTEDKKAQQGRKGHGDLTRKNSLLQREIFKHCDEDSPPREDKIIHSKDTKSTKTKQSRLGFDMICLSGLRDLVVNYSVFVAFVSSL